ncbi:MAG: hypothetical protein IJT06_00255 [Selenomonadaceae bacterium]|nr:hypothetical protein [Selenomonadaceae bacterium]
MAMTKAEKHQCEDVIKHHARDVLSGKNHIMIPYELDAVDEKALTTMTMALVKVSNVTISETLATKIAQEKLNKQFLSKRMWIPISCPMIHPSILTVAMVESAGWKIAEYFAN